jgi:uncharacterized membrane protein
MGFWKAFGAFIVVLGGVTKVLEVSAEHLPTWLGWLGAAATWLWGVLSYTAPVPVIIALPIAAVIYKLVSVIAGLDAAADAKERARHREEIAEREKAIKLSAEERSVVHTLVHADPPVDYRDLERETGLTRLRLSHAITQLVSRDLVHKDSDYFWFTSEGQKYVVDNNLDVVNAS